MNLKTSVLPLSRLLIQEVVKGLPRTHPTNYFFSYFCQMKKEIETGLSKVVEIIVDFEQTAAHYGSGLVEVFATPAMIALMEKAALEAVLPYLSENEGTVGTRVEVSHLKATPVGMKVTCKAVLKEVEKRRLLFEVEAHDEEGLIGSGLHERFIINVEKFMQKIGK